MQIGNKVEFQRKLCQFAVAHIVFRLHSLYILCITEPKLMVVIRYKNTKKDIPVP